jgi:hypothetical protein
MNSHLNIIAKKIVVLTLIAGFFVMPIAPILAEETSAPVSDPIVEVAPVEEIVPETTSEVVEVIPEIEIIAETPEEVIILEEEVLAEEEPVLEEVTIEEVTEEVVEEEALVLEATAPVTKANDFVQENSFTTTPEEVVVVDEETSDIASELSFATLSGDPLIISSNMTISDENPFESEEEGTVVTPGLSTISTEGNFTTADPTSIDDDNFAIGTENSFTTLNDIIDNDEDLAVGEENTFTTLDNSTEGNTTVSEENTFTTLDNFNDDETTVSEENSFTTLTGNDDTDPAVSDEQTFTTLDNFNDDDTTVSEENSFTTLDGDIDDNTAISDEMSFTTLDTIVINPNGENTFTTLSNGGGGGGGGGGSGGGYVLAQQTYSCGILLHEFIKYGQANNRLEVIKLQIFLRTFEGFNNLQVTGVYDLPTYRAVEIFQKRYAQDILGPWEIDDSTGYVYITTRLAINNIFCGRSTTNDLDLRNFYREYKQATGEDFVLTPNLDDTDTDEGYVITATSTDDEATSTPVVKRSWLMAGLGGLLDFIGGNLCWLLNLLLLLIIFFLLWLLWTADRDDDNSTGGEGVPLKGHIANGDMGLIGAVALDEIMSEDDKLVLDALAEEEESQIPAANNDPDQHSINL